MQVTPYSKNAKKHPDSQLRQIADSVTEFGWQQPIVVDKEGVIIVGHGRWQAYLKYGLTEPPTMKPVGLMGRAIMNSSLPENIVLDTFLGSGSTLIASQKTGRTCYGMELDPKYVDVIVERYCEYTGTRNIKRNGETIVWEGHAK